MEKIKIKNKICKSVAVLTTLQAIMKEKKSVFFLLNLSIHAMDSKRTGKTP